MHPIAAESSENPTAVQLRDALLREDFVLINTLLQSNPELLETKDNSEYTPLLFAINNGLLASTRFLLEAGANTKAKSVADFTCLHLAVVSGLTEAIPDLVKYGAELDAPDQFGDTALHEAATKGNISAVRKLVDAGASLGIQNEQGETALHSAIFALNDSIACFLITHDSPINTFKTDGTFPLLDACKSRNIIVIKALLAKRAKVNLQDLDGNTVFHIAAEKDFTEVFSPVLNKGGDLTITNAAGNTALHVAARCHNISTLREIIPYYRIGLKIQNNERKTPLCSVFDDYPSVDRTHDLQLARDTLKLLLREGANPNITDQSNYNPLWYALQYSDEEAAITILNYGVRDIAAPNDPNNLQNSYLHRAAFANMKKVVEKLLNEGVPFDGHNLFNETPLAKAVQGDALAVAEKLLERGANPNTQDAMHFTPLMVSCSRGSMHMTELLIRYNAILTGVADPQNAVYASPLTMACANDRPEHAVLLLNAGAPIHFHHAFHGPENVLTPRISHIITLYQTSDSLYNDRLRSQNSNELLTKLFTETNTRQNLRPNVPFIGIRYIALAPSDQKEHLKRASQIQQAHFLFESKSRFYIRYYFQQYLAAIKSERRAILAKEHYDSASQEEKSNLFEPTHHPLALLPIEMIDKISGLDRQHLDEYPILEQEDILSVRNRLYRLKSRVEWMIDRKIERIVPGIDGKNPKNIPQQTLQMRTTDKSFQSSASAAPITPHFNAKGMRNTGRHQESDELPIKKAKRSQGRK